MISKKHLIIPGLNQSMNLFDFLSPESLNIQILKLPCTGNDKDLYLNEKFVNYGKYFKDLVGVYENVFCHSLGSLVFLSQIEKVKFKKVFLIAPAFQTWKPLEYLFKLLPEDLLTPSLNLASRRAFSFCSISLYRQVVDLQKEIRVKCENGEFDKYEIYVIHDPRDELVRPSDLFEYFKYVEYYSGDFPRHLCLDFIEKYISDPSKIIL